MAFSLDRFFAELRTRAFGRATEYHEEVTSTIDAAWQWLSRGGPEGGAVIAGRQTQGRGRNGRQWGAPEGGLWLSVLARPPLGIAQAGRLGMAMALAAAEGVEAVAGGRVGLKWPNDVLLAGGKLAGVLVETQTQGGTVSAAVLSAGINVNVRRDDLPEAARATAATLLEVTGREYGLEEVAARVLEALERHWPAVLGDGVALAAGWREREVLRGTEVCVEFGEARLCGEARGVDADGALVVLIGGVEQRVTVGEVRRVRAGS